MLNSCPHASGFPPALYLDLRSNAISSEKPSLIALMLSIIALYLLTLLCLHSILLLLITIFAHYICICLFVLWFLHWVLSSKMAKTNSVSDTASFALVLRTDARYMARTYIFLEKLMSAAGLLRFLGKFMVSLL